MFKFEFESLATTASQGHIKATRLRSRVQILTVFTNGSNASLAAYFHDAALGRIVATHGLGQLLCLPLQRSIRIVRRERLGYVTDQERFNSTKPLILHYVSEFVSDQPAVVIASLENNAAAKRNTSVAADGSL